jgi:hypothetical protein
VEERDGFDLALAGVVFEPATARARDAFAHFQKRRRRRPAETDQNIGIHKFDLPLDEGQADRGFLRRRRPVSRRPWNSTW